MENYIYLVGGMKTHDACVIQEILNKCGQQGWELVLAQPESSSIMFYFKQKSVGTARMSAQELGFDIF